MPHLGPLVVGNFWFRKAKYFTDAAKNLIENDITINNEHYVGISINYLIEKGKKLSFLILNNGLVLAIHSNYVY